MYKFCYVSEHINLKNDSIRKKKTILRVEKLINTLLNYSKTFTKIMGRKKYVDKCFFKSLIFVSFRDV